ncbi:FtsK/SpoIIIE domain-containing protein [Fimbriiglobus ruber]|nr:FtsK/SpoIIIE domain-containing protein [Fimbriiglobus ruber]
MSTNSLFDQQRTALARLQQLVRDRSTGERSVSDTFDAAAAEADREVQKARRTLAAARKKAHDELLTAHETAMEEIGTRSDTARADADRGRLDTRKKMVDQFSAQLKTARSEYQDKIWTVDSLYEAAEKETTDRYQELKRTVATATKHVAAAWDTATTVLVRTGLSRERVAFDPARLPPPTPTDPIGKVQKCLEDADAASDRLNRASLPKLLGVVPTLGMAVLAGLLAAAVVIPLFSQSMNIKFAFIGAWAVVGGVFLRVLVGVLAKRQVRDRGMALGVYLAEADRATQLLDAHANKTYAEQKRLVAEQHATNKKKTDDHYQPKIADLEKRLTATLIKIDADHAAKIQELGTGRTNDLRTETERYDKAAAYATKRFDAEVAAAEKRFADKTAAAEASRDKAWNQMSAAWQGGVEEVRGVCTGLTTFGTGWFPAWANVSSSYAPPKEVPAGVRYGSLDVNLFALPNGRPDDPRLDPPEPFHVAVPAYLPFPDKCAILLKASDEGRPACVAALQAMMLRFLTGLPPGKVRFTIIDPVGLGENFAAFMHLADYDENLVTSRIWTEPQQIETKLADLTEHMENVIQKYLRNQYKSIEDYNRAAGEVAEPYRVLVIANFPVNFSPAAARRLISIMSSGPACGVCTLVGVDTRATLPRDFRLEDLEQVALTLNWANGKFHPQNEALAAFPLAIEAPPPSDAVAAIVRKVGQASKDAARVEVPFEYIAPAPDKVWTASAAKGFEIPIGRAGATRRQIMSLGRGTAQHGLIAGKTGSGKSTLLHALITNLALTYSPDEAELYMIDFKKGVEFKMYAQFRLPHARVVAIESEREFGLSVLQRLDGILRERGDAFRDLGVNDLAGYREAKPGVRSPRILFVVDEFQEFFVEDDKLAQEAALLLDRLVRQGRAFGVHVILGSQTLGGAFSLARSTIDQMAVRIALQCSEADAQLILSKDNTAARLLNRPGEAIYNDANGMVEGNDPFQVVWLSEDLRERYLVNMRDRAADKGYPAPLVFEGSSAADMSRNVPLSRLLAAAPDQIPAGPPTAWLGEAIAIKDPTAAVFRPQSAANMLMLGQHEEGALGLATAALVALAARFRPSAAAPGSTRTFTVVDGTPDDSEYADYLRNAANAIGLTGSVVERSELQAALGAVAGELDRRQKGETADRSPKYLIIHGLHRLRELRKSEDDFGFGRKGEKQASPGEMFATILREGPPLSIHVIAWCDSLTNLQRAMDRQGLKEFALRVLFQMSASDSSHLIDSPLASRLGRNRALFLEEGTERPEKFRPYGLPAMTWLREVAEKIGMVFAEGT